MAAVIVLVVIYLRVSTEEQAREGHSLSEQRAMCTDRAHMIAADLERQGQRVNLQIVEFLDDFGGDIVERPVLEEMRAFIRERKPSYFICLDPDRFSRNLHLQLIVTDDIEGAGTTMVFVQHNYERTPEGRLFYQMRGAFSEFEKAKILERTQRGKRGKVKAGGRPNGACPYGYTHLKADPKAGRPTDTLTINDDQARWVRQVYEWVVYDNLGIIAIATRLTELGVPTKQGGSHWYRSVVRDILCNRTYRGEMIVNRKDFRGLSAIHRLPREKRRPLSPRRRPAEEWMTIPAPQIIPPELWDTVQARLPRNSARGGSRGGNRNVAMLSRLAICGVCGSHLSYQRHAAGRIYLHCHHRYPHLRDYRPGMPACTFPFVRAEPVEAFVWKKIRAWLTNPDVLQADLERQLSITSTADALGRQEQLLSNLRGQLQEKIQAQVTTMNARNSGQLVEEAATLILAETKGQIDRLRTAITDAERDLAALQQIRQVQGPVDRYRSMADALEGEVTAMLDLVEQVPEKQRLLVMDALERVVVYPDRDPEIFPRGDRLP